MVDLGEEGLVVEYSYLCDTLYTHSHDIATTAHEEEQSHLKIICYIKKTQQNHTVYNMLFFLSGGYHLKCVVYQLKSLQSCPGMTPHHCMIQALVPVSTQNIHHNRSISLSAPQGTNQI